MKTVISKDQGVGIVLLLASTGLGLFACTSSVTPSATSSTGVSLTGSLAGVTDGRSMKRNASTTKQRTVSYTGDSVVCTTMTNPPTTAKAAVNADGSFNISITGGVNQPMNCNLVDSSGNLLAAIVSSDSTHTDMGGNPTTQSTMAYSASANLGAISYDPATGKASVPVANIQSSLAPAPAAASVYDPTGEWTIAAVPFAVPTGYSALCSQDSQNCNGPPAGQKIALQQFKGVQISGGASVIGLQIWQGGNAAKLACGASVTGMADGGASVGVDFSGLGAQSAGFTYATTVNFGGGDHTLTNNYEFVADAVSEYPTQNGCASQMISIGGTSSPGWVCHALAVDNSTTLYQASGGGGCVVTSTGVPVQMNGINPPNGSFTTTDLGGGYSLQSNSGNVTINNVSTNVTCTNIMGIFADSGLTTPVVYDSGNTATQFDWAHITQINAGKHCSNSDTGGNPFTALQAAQCYAQYFQQNVGDHSTACLKRVDTDWSASTVNQVNGVGFLHIGTNPRSLVAFNEFHPDPSGQGGAMRMEQNQIQGVQSASGQGYTACNTFEVDEFTYKKIDENTLLAGYQSTTITTDAGIPDCVANFGTAGNGSVQKFMFLLTK